MRNIDPKQRKLLIVLVPLLIIVILTGIFLFNSSRNNSSKDNLPPFDSRSVSDSLRTFYNKYALTGSQELLSSKLVAAYGSKNFNASYVQQLTKPVPPPVDPVICTQYTANSITVSNVVVTDNKASANVTLDFADVIPKIKIVVNAINENGPKIDKITCPK